MWNCVGLGRTAKRLDRAGNLLRELKSEIGAGGLGAGAAGSVH